MRTHDRSAPDESVANARDATQASVSLVGSVPESEEAMRKGDEAMNRGAGRAGTRSAVEFYEVPIDASI